MDTSSAFMLRQAWIEQEAKLQAALADSDRSTVESKIEAMELRMMNLALVVSGMLTLLERLECAVPGE